MPNLTTLQLPERFDFACYKTFNESADAALKDTNSNLISLDFSEVSYLDSAALGMVVYLHKKAGAVNKKIQIVNATGIAEEILNVANIHKILEVK